MLVASNPLIQVTPGLMIWTIVCFLIALFVLRRYAFGPVQTMIDKRRDQIAQSIAEADAARIEARELLEEHRALIGQAKNESAEILAQARKVADAHHARAREEAELDRARRLDETLRQIEAETSRALDQIRTEVADLTVEATQRVVGKVLDTADHRRLVDEAIADLDFSVLEGGRN